MSGGASISRDVHRLLKGATAKLAGRNPRGPDIGEGRRVPHRKSFLETTPEAKPWARIGDGSVAAGLAHREAIIETAEQLRVDQWRKFPLQEVRQARLERDAAATELEELATRSPAELPVGRPAALRQRIEQLDAKIEAADRRLRRTDLTVLKALLAFLDFKTGKLFPAHETIAEKAGCHLNTVKAALKRLNNHGFIDWVRRTARTGNEGEFAPQLEQTSNAYFFDNRRKMAKTTWSRFVQILTAKMRRIGRTPQGLAAAPVSDPSPPPAPGSLAAAIADLGAAVSRAST
ncbi:helix-turn-helix domain-containing protein [Sphingomonas sp. IC4-52]|uniref:helix-turn-helix domain-containing protein n=1 Tax=Sphingomonas sp. IC4-52 TaxID=2887202 RepID=UPI001D11A99A|nr:helix-turn-helix domain-containing protein [Sphingomonas sp. IC4-52]MCC2978900.1 helix-turn-helix domain-containing protein [Sphingomonas sp. IC4-52]